jgi:amino acid transporter
MKKKYKEILKLSGIPVFIASLCCVTPILFVVFGLGTVTFASSLADNLYGEHKWYFRLAGLVVMAGTLVWYFYKSKGICTIDQAKKRRNEILNTILLSLIVGVLGYIFFLYVVVHYIGVWLKLWA